MQAEFIRIYNENPNPREIQRVVEVLRKGGLVIYPTDTVYGLGCDITKTKALFHKLPQSVRYIKIPKIHPVKTAAGSSLMSKPVISLALRLIA